MSTYYKGRVDEIVTHEAQCHICERVERFEVRSGVFWKEDHPEGWRVDNVYTPTDEWGYNTIYITCDQHPEWVAPESREPRWR